MKKRFFCFILAVCLIIPCMLSIIGCTTTLTKEDYIKVYDSFSDTLGACVNDQVSTVSANIPDSDFVDSNNSSQALNMSQACRALIMFVRNIYAREDYVIKNTYDDCIVIDNYYADNPYTMNIRIKTSYDSNSSTITTVVYVDYEMNFKVYVQYYIFDIEYDFPNEKLNGFEISGFTGRKDNETVQGVEYYKYRDNNLKNLSHSAESFELFATQVLADMNTIRTPERATNPADYSTEYWDAMNKFVVGQ